MLDIPHHIGNRSCRRQQTLKLVAEGYDESGQDVSGIGLVEVADEILEPLLHLRTLNSREFTRSHHVCDEGDTMFGADSRICHDPCSDSKHTHKIGDVNLKRLTSHIATNID